MLPVLHCRYLHRLLTKKNLHVHQVKRSLPVLTFFTSLQFQCQGQRAKQALPFDIICVWNQKLKVWLLAPTIWIMQTSVWQSRIRSGKICMPVTFFIYQINNCRYNLCLMLLRKPWWNDLAESVHFVRCCPHYLWLQFAPQIALNDALLCFKTLNLIRLLLSSVSRSENAN
jgi:hypothetical protein